ncbi:hypothetical protein BC567DRAFT_102554 [Phyllosticta citribraziliensis]
MINRTRAWQRHQRALDDCTAVSSNPGAVVIRRLVVIRDFIFIASTSAIFRPFPFHSSRQFTYNFHSRFELRKTSCFMLAHVTLFHSSLLHSIAILTVLDATISWKTFACTTCQIANWRKDASNIQLLTSCCASTCLWPALGETFMGIVQCGESAPAEPYPLVSL